MATTVSIVNAGAFTTVGPVVGVVIVANAKCIRRRAGCARRVHVERERDAVERAEHDECRR